MKFKELDKIFVKMRDGSSINAVGNITINVIAKDGMHLLEIYKPGEDDVVYIGFSNSEAGKYHVDGPTSTGDEISLFFQEDDDIPVVTEINNWFLVSTALRVLLE